MTWLGKVLVVVLAMGALAACNGGTTTGLGGSGNFVRGSPSGDDDEAPDNGGGDQEQGAGEEGGDAGDGGQP